ncbi:MAG: hypothetical protein ACLTKI_04500 [Lachnospiraceae bacterium]
MDCSTLLKQQIQRYPQMEIRDVCKLLYQRNFGCGHLVTEEKQSLRRLQDEAKEYGQYLQQNAEVKDSSRLMWSQQRIWTIVSGILDEGLSVETLNQIFCESAKAGFPGDSLAELSSAEAAVRERVCLEQELQEFLDLCQEGELPFSEKEAAEEIHRWRAAGFPAVSHSEAYRTAYHPAYRVAESRYLSYLPVFVEIDRKLQEKENTQRITIAIDGPCAGGKTTLGELLERIYGCSLFHMDDFFLRPEQRTEARYKEPGGNVDYERFRAEVLDRLDDENGVTYQRYDCHLGQLHETVHVPRHRLNLVEGAYSQHPYFGDCYDIRFYLDAGLELRLDRILKRNGPCMLERFKEQWIPMEEAYFQAFEIRKKSQVIFAVDIDKEKLI